MFGILKELIRDHRLRIPGVGIVLAVGDSVPSNGVTGYARGCLFFYLNGEPSTSLWVNTGDTSGSAFVPVETA